MSTLTVANLDVTTLTSSTTLVMGNTTVNTTSNSTLIQLRNTTTTTNASASGLVVGTSVVNSTAINATAIFVNGAAVLTSTGADQTITGGARVTVLDLGNSGTGTITPDPGDRPQQKYTNNGAHTLAPGSNPGNYLLDVLNTTGAGAITTSGWTKVAGDSFDTTITSKFRCSASITSDFSLLSVAKIV